MNLSDSIVSHLFLLKRVEHSSQIRELRLRFQHPQNVRKLFRLLLLLLLLTILYGFLRPRMGRDDRGWNSAGTRRRRPLIPIGRRGDDAG